MQPDDGVIQRDFELISGRPLDLELRLGARSLDVLVKPEPGGLDHPATWLEVRCKDADGRRQANDYAIPPDNRTHVPNLEAGALVLVALSDRGKQLGMMRVDGAETAREIEFQLVEHTTHFRVRDRRGEPVVGAWIKLLLDGDGSGWLRTLETKGDGTAELRGLPRVPVIVSVWSPNVGLAPGRVIDLAQVTQEPVELVLDPTRAMRVRALERERAVPGLDLAASDVFGVYAGLGQATTDDAGVAQWPAISDGEYIVEVDHPGWWRTRANVLIATESGVVELQVRRLGSLELRVSSALQHPIEGAELALISLEERTSVSTWIERGSVRSPTTGLRTDTTGALRIDGLPNGEFEWRVTTKDGGSKSGRVMVAPSAVTQLPIILDA